MLMNQDFVPYIDHIMPSLLNMVNLTLNKEQKTKTSESDDADLAINSINIFIEFFPKHMGKYSEQIYQIVQKAQEKIVNPEVKLSAIGLFPGLIKVSKNIEGYNWANFSK